MSEKKLLRGDRNQCPGCGEYFNSTHAFEKHRSGPMSDRFCLTPEAMLSRGMAKNSAGFWVGSINPVYASEAYEVDS